MGLLKNFFQLLLALAVAGLVIGTVAAIGLYFYFAPSLPNIESLRTVQFQTPLKVLSADGKLIAEFGEKKRIPVKFEEIPNDFVKALQAAEDARYFEHHGIDIKGLTRAAVQLISTGKKQSGGSTITMQVAKNFFLSRDRTFERKFSEILLALKIDSALSKEEVFELYVNKIFLGYRSYGIQAAANTYYGKGISEINLAQLAMIAGLPKAPSKFNPLSNPQRALERRDWILGRMLELGYIDQTRYQQAVEQPVTARYHTSEIELEAPYIAEMVRSQLYEQYGDDLYTEGLTVHTTIDSKMQLAANQALRAGLLSYVKRHGYRGPEKQHDLSGLDGEQLVKLVKAESSFGGITPALVIEVAKQSAKVLTRDGQTHDIPWQGLSWAREFKSVNSMGPKPKKASDVVTVGDIVRIKQLDDHWALSQIPKVQGALVAMDPAQGAIRALVGGFSFSHNKFNRAAQAKRQPGSNLKPFIYAAALENGFTAATTINDAPIVLQGASLQANWRPENSSRKFYGPTRLRVGLYLSRNLVSIRLLRAIGIPAALDYLQRVGINTEGMPQNLSLSLGSADMTPLELITGYAPFANGGYQVDNYVIDKIVDVHEGVSFQAIPKAAPGSLITQSGKPYTQAQQTIDPRDGYMIYSILRDVIRRGTATKAKVLKRNDLAGKTGTTNLQRDAWFTGFNHKLVATAWVGYDQPSPLGKREFGGTAALPVWIDFMREVLAETEEAPVPVPAGLVQVGVDPKSGLRAYSGQANAITELMKAEDVERLAAQTAESNDTTTEDIF